MDKKKSSATASSHGEKKDENFLTKTAHSIRDKVQGLTDDVKEKTKKRNRNSKKSKTDKDKKPEASSKAGKKDSSSDSDDDEKPSSSSATASGVQKDRKRDIDKSNLAQSKSPRSSFKNEKKDVALPVRSQTALNKPTANDSPNKRSGDSEKLAAAATTDRSSSKSHNDNSATKRTGLSSNDKSNNKNTDHDDTINKRSSEENNNDRIHISFNGISTVTELLDRIDEGIESAKLVIQGGKGKIGLTIDSNRPPRPQINVEKKVTKDVEDKQNKEKEEDEEEPIRIDYNQIRRIEDLLVKLNDQPGHRKVVLINAPDNSNPVPVKQEPKLSRKSSSSSTSSNENDSSSSTTTNENDDSSAPPKSILKTSQNPSSLDTSTKTSSFQDGQIHVNIEGIQNLENLLDRIDDAVENTPVVIDTKRSGEKRQAPQAPNRSDSNNQPTTKTPPTTQKREAPKAPSSANNQNINDNTIEKKDKIPLKDNNQKENDKTPTIKVDEHEFQSNDNNKQISSSSPINEKKNDKNEQAEWI